MSNLWFAEITYKPADEDSDEYAKLLVKGANAYQAVASLKRWLLESGIRKYEVTVFDQMQFEDDIVDLGYLFD